MQIFLALGQGLATNPQHMMQFTPLLYSYQMAMAQAAQVAGKYLNTHFFLKRTKYFTLSRIII